jgi:putative endonuclease
MSQFTTMSTRELGCWGEDYACELIAKQGFEIQHRNWRFSRYGEIDIIAKHNRILVFIEVKTRRASRSGTPFEAITYQKYQQIRKIAQGYLKQFDDYAPEIRVDAIGISVQQRKIRVKHIHGVQMW